MLKLTVNQKHKHTAEFTNEERTAGKLDGKDFTWDIVEIKKNSFHIIKDHKSYTAEVVKADHQAKTFIIKVNGSKYTVTAKDKYDELLQRLGMDAGGAVKINELKAPMPGLVLDVLVKEGDKVKKGDALVVLEAMKMENILKCPADTVIKKINAKKGMAVEKNQVLINFQ